MPQQPRNQLTISLSVAEYAELQARATKHGTSMATIVRNALALKASK